MSETKPPIIKLINLLSRFTQSYSDEIFEEYELTSGMYPFLLNLNKNEGINQNQISRELGVDKAMSARAIKKLIELEYVRKEEDSKDSRAYNLFLTEKAKNIIPKIYEGINGWINQISEGVSEEDRDRVVDSLSIMLENARSIRNKAMDKED